MKTGVVISTVNEANTIGHLVQTLCALQMDVFVVDGNSEDKTWLYASNNGATVYVYDKPQGIREHLMQGWRMALKAGCDVIVQMDAGGSHDPLQIDDLIWATRFADVVIGSRFCEGGKYIGNPKRRFMSQLAAFAMNFKTKQSFTDWTSGYRAFRKGAVMQLLECSYFADMHAFQIEVLDWATLLGLAVAEIPITYTAGRSSFNRNVAREALDVWWLT